MAFETFGVVTDGFYEPGFLSGFDFDEPAARTLLVTDGYFSTWVVTGRKFWRNASWEYYWWKRIKKP